MKNLEFARFARLARLARLSTRKWDFRRCSRSRPRELAQRSQDDVSLNKLPQIKLIKTNDFGLKWVHMARYELILRQDGAIWLRIIFQPLLTFSGRPKNPKIISMSPHWWKPTFNGTNVCVCEREARVA